VEELTKYMPVDSYGSCLHNKDFPNDLSKLQNENHGTYVTRLIQIISEYKFMLAFENDNITDYVTEKLMLGFKAGTLPVYMGAPNVDNWLPAEKSIIKTDNFRDPKELAEYLKKT